MPETMYGHTRQRVWIGLHLTGIAAKLYPDSASRKRAFEDMPLLKISSTPRLKHPFGNTPSSIPHTAEVQI